MLAGGLEQYKQVQVNTASGVHLVIMVLDAAIKHLSLAQAAMDKGRFDDAAASLDRVSAIIKELSGSLDFRAGDIARKLFRLYEFCGYKTIQAGLKRDPKVLEPVKDVLKILREGWVECARSQRAKCPPPEQSGFQVVVG